MSSSPSPGKTNSFFNTSFSDELVQVPPKKFRVKRGSNEEVSRRTPSKTLSQSSRATSRSLSPSTMRNATVLSPILSPVLKGLRRLSRSHRSADNDHDDEDGETSSLAPIQPLKDLQEFRHVAEVFEQEQPKHWSLQDTKALMPPSGRWISSEEELQQQQPEQSPPPQQPLPTSLSSSSIPPPTDPNNASKPSSSSSVNSNKPPSGRTTPEDGRAPILPPPSEIPTSTKSSKSRTTKPSSWSSSTQKPPSTSSTGSGDSSTIPPRPRRTHRASDETTTSAAGNVKPQTKPRRARSAAPQVRSTPHVTTTNSAKTQESSHEPVKETSKTHSQDSLEHSGGMESTTLGSERRSRRTSPAALSAKQSTGKSMTVTNPMIEDTSTLPPTDSKTTTDEVSKKHNLHEQPRKGQGGLSKQEKHGPPEASSTTISAPVTTTTTAATAASITKRASTTRATPEQREVLQRLRSKSKDKSNAATTNTESSTRTVPSEQRDRSSRRARSRSRDKSDPNTAPEGEEKSLRRGKKPLSQSDSLKAAADETTSKSTSTTHRHSTRRQRSNPPETTRKSAMEEAPPKTELPQLLPVHQDDNHQSSDFTDDKVEKPDSARRLEIMRKNLDKQTLAHVQDLKEEIKQMRNQRRKVKFGAKGDASGPAQSESESATAPQQQPVQQHQQPQAHSVSPIKSPSASKARQISMQASLMAIAQSPFHNSGGTIKSDLSASKSTLHSSKLIADFNNSIGAIGLEDLDFGYVNLVPPPPSEDTVKMEALQKQLRKTKKLIKRTTRDVWAERDEIINLQRKNWSIRKALMQHEGPPDSLTTLNMKIEKLLRQDRELELETDQLHEQKDALEAECAKAAKKIGDFKELFDKLHKIIVPLLPLPEDTPQEIGAFQSGPDSISPLPSPSGTNRQAVTLHLSQARAMDDIEDLSVDSSDEDEAKSPNAANDNEDEASLSLSHLRAATSRA